MPKLTLTKTEAKVKGAAYCAYQERCQQEVRDKLYGYGLYQEEVEEVLTELIIEGFVNEERFARAFAGGRFRMKQWGRIKITMALKQKGVSDYCIKAGLSEIGEEDYRHTLEMLLVKKASTEKEADTYKKRQKLARFAIARGFEPDVVWPALESLAEDTVD